MKNVKKEDKTGKSNDSLSLPLPPSLCLSLS